jgi:hypothetical protein
MNNGIGSIDLSNFAVVDTNLIDTVVTGFAYDTTNRIFYVTQTDFFSFSSGRVYDRGGNRTDTLQVGFSPEVVRIFYDQFVGIEAQKRENQISFELYPNPAKNFISIELDEGFEAQHLRLFDRQGRLVREERLKANSKQIDLSGQPKGLYFLELLADQQRLTKAFIIQ